MSQILQTVKLQDFLAAFTFVHCPISNVHGGHKLLFLATGNTLTSQTVMVFPFFILKLYRFTSSTNFFQGCTQYPTLASLNCWEGEGLMSPLLDTNQQPPHCKIRWSCQQSYRGPVTVIPMPISVIAAVNDLAAGEGMKGLQMKTKSGHIRHCLDCRSGLHWWWWWWWTWWGWEQWWWSRWYCRDSLWRW